MRKVIFYGFCSVKTLFTPYPIILEEYGLSLQNNPTAFSAWNQAKNPMFFHIQNIIPLTEIFVSALRNNRNRSRPSCVSIRIRLLIFYCSDELFLTVCTLSLPCRSCSEASLFTRKYSAPLQHPQHSMYFLYNFRSVTFRCHLETEKTVFLAENILVIAILNGSE